MKPDWNRILSTLLVAGYFVTGCLAGGPKMGFVLVMFTAFPLACIWFSEAMGGHIGLHGYIGITESSPPFMVRILGWVLLIIPFGSILL